MKKALTAFLLLVPFCCFANSTHKKLDSVKAKISTVKQQLHQDLAQRNKLEQQLEQAELHISTLQKQLNNTNAKKLEQNKKLNTSLKKEKATQQRIQTQLLELAKQIKSSYLLGPQPFLKLLLSEQSPEKRQRMLTYYQYFNQERINTILKLQALLTLQKQQQASIIDHSQTLKALSIKQHDESQALKSTQNNRKNVIHALSKKISSRKAQLDNLLQNQRQLTRAVQKAQKQKLKRSIKYNNFRVQKGRLPWPTKGKRINLFGTHIDKSELQYEGIVINAPEGQAIHAIANGVVVFAKWLPGYGQLMIINHGKGYMSLYGRCHSLDKKVGDVVKQGETIATVGNTGGFSRSGLYFAIRQNAKPQNPTRWCQR